MPPFSSHASDTPVAMAQALRVMRRTALLSPSALLMVLSDTPMCCANSATVMPVSERAFRSLSPSDHSGTSAYRS